MKLGDAFEKRPTPPPVKAAVGSKRKAGEILRPAVPSITKVVTTETPPPPAPLHRAPKKSKGKAPVLPADTPSDAPVEIQHPPPPSPDHSPVVEILMDERSHPVRVFERLVPHIHLKPDSGDRSINKLGEDTLNRFFEHTGDFVELFNRAKKLDSENDALYKGIERRVARIKGLKAQLAEEEKRREELVEERIAERLKAEQEKHAAELEAERKKSREEAKAREEKMISMPSNFITQAFYGTASSDAYRAMLRTEPGLRMTREYGNWAFQKGKKEMLETVHDFLSVQLDAELYEEIKVLLPGDVPEPGPAPYTDFPEGSSGAAQEDAGKDQASAS